MMKCRIKNKEFIHTQNFSLVELLVVMVIMGIMLGMFLPLFDSMTSTSKLNSSVRLIGSQLNLARQYAQAEGEYVALIIPGEITNASPAQDIPDERKFRAYRLATATNSAGIYTFSSWIDGTKWEYLPTGYSIMEADDDVGILKVVSGTAVYLTTPEENNTSSSSAEVLAVPFDAPLFHETTDFTGTCRAVIYARSGKARPVGTHRYVTIGEATKLSGTWIVKNPYADTAITGIKNLSATNQMTIEINGFTSGLTYIVPEKYDDYD